MRLYILLLISGLLARPGLALLTDHPGLFDPNRHYSLARNLAEGRGFVVYYIWLYRQRPTVVTHPVDYWMRLAAVWLALSMRVSGTGLLPALLPNIFFSTALGDAPWPFYDGSKSNDRLPLPCRTSHSRLFGIADA